MDLGAKSSHVEPGEVTEAFVRTLPGGMPYDCRVLGVAVTTARPRPYCGTT
ncbi:hypothetical protein [Streptomyces sp. PRh5]|uniref:hypothetical protein n=1 Tax=Streptomyces sp. PRh5 TaxID=1158056 RepID=UPI0004AEC316|nr:hypothetical protein [Streptomyces sp. PRh5]